MTYYQYKNSAIAVPERGKIALSLAIIFGLVLLSVFYLIQINSIVAKNFELRSAQSALKEKQEKNQQLMVDLTQARSLKSLESAAKDLNLVAVEKVDYLKTLTGFFALSQ